MIIGSASAAGDQNDPWKSFVSTTQRIRRLIASALVCLRRDKRCARRYGLSIYRLAAKNCFSIRVFGETTCPLDMASHLKAISPCLPSRGGRMVVFRLRFLSPFLPKSAFDGGMCELADVLRGLPTSALNSNTRAAICSFISFYASRSSFFSAALSTTTGCGVIHRVN